MEVEQKRVKGEGEGEGETRQGRKGPGILKDTQRVREDPGDDDDDDED